MKKRELCGIYFRVKRDGKYENICFTDMTEEEQKRAIYDFSPESLRNMCMVLAAVFTVVSTIIYLTSAYRTCPAFRYLLWKRTVWYKMLFDYQIYFLRYLLLSSRQ